MERRDKPARGWKRPVFIKQMHEERPVEACKQKSPACAEPFLIEPKQQQSNAYSLSLVNARFPDAKNPAARIFLQKRIVGGRII